jgi:hypothetical protein
MGVFKEASYFGNDAFFEQLFKHEGVCVWNDDDLYDFMSDARESSWTEGCVSTGVQGNAFYFGENGYSGNNYLYIDLKPTWNGNMTYGLYTDSICKTEYEGQDVSVDTVAASMGLLYGSDLETWNDALEIYKVCQPCKAYNLQSNYISSSGYYDDDSFCDSDPNDCYFQCDDAADYTNVNQCMKFRTHAELEVATWEDLVTATNQGGILQVNVGGTIFGSDRMSQEEYEYMLTQRRSKLATEEKKATTEAAKESAIVEAMRPGAERWQKAGSFSVFLGAMLFAFALLKAFKNHCCCCCRTTRNEHLSEPLMAYEQA